MFYVKELLVRLFYCLFGGFCFFVVSWCKIMCLQTCYFGYMMDIIQKFSVDQSIHFIYTAPLEIFEINFQICFFLSIICMLFLIVQGCFGFFKSSFYFSEYYSFVFFLCTFLFGFYVYTSWILYEGLVFFITFFNLFLQNLVNLTFFNLFLELKILDYFNFINYCFFTLQFIFIMFMLIFLISYFIQISFIFKFKEFIYFFQILIIFLYTPPDFLNLFILSFLIYILFELFIFCLCVRLTLYTFYISTFKKKLKYRRSF